MDSTRIHDIFVIGGGINVGALVSKVGALIGVKGVAWTRNAELPGKGPFSTRFPKGVTALKREYPFLDVAPTIGPVRPYGARAATLSGAAPPQCRPRSISQRAELKHA